MKKTKKMLLIEKNYKLDIKEVLYILHHVNNKPLYKIAEDFDIGQHAVGKWFKLFRIPVINRTQFKKGNMPPNKLKKPSIEIRKKISDSVKKLWENTEYAVHQSNIRRGNIAWNKGLTKETDERIKRQGEKHKGFKHKKNTKKIMSEKKKEHWKDEKIAKKMIAGLNIQPNKAELFLNTILQKRYPNEWKYVGDGQVIINGLCPDFINCNGKKKIIELFGERWHTGDIRYNQTEKGRKEIFAKFGFETLIIWDYELTEKEIIQKMENFYGRK